MPSGGQNGDGPVEMPEELRHALDIVDGWDEWDEQDERIRSLYCRWVGKPRRARERRARAETTAYYASVGALKYGVNNHDRDRTSIVGDILEFVLGR